MLRFRWLGGLLLWGGGRRWMDAGGAIAGGCGIVLLIRGFGEKCRRRGSRGEGARVLE